MAGALIGALRVSLSAETSAFEAGMKRSQRTAKTTANSIAGSFKSAGGAINVLKAGVAGFIASLSVGTILAAGKAALDYAASLGETAGQLGVTTRELQNFRAAAMQSGASMEEADSALGKLTLNISKALSGSKQAAAAFSSVGVSISDMTTKSRWEIIGQIADQMNRQGGAAKNAAAGVAIFGRGFQKIIPTLDQGSAGINALADANERLGGVLSDREIQNADRTADKIEQLYLVLKTKLASDVAANSNAIAEFAQFLFRLVDAATKARQALADFQANYNLFNIGTGKAFGFGYKGRSVTTKLGEGGTADAEARRRGLKLMSDVPRTAGTPPQFLAGGGGGRSGGRSRADDSERKRLEAMREENQFDQQIRRAKIDVLEATRDLASDAVERYALSIQIKDAEKAAFEADLQYQVASKEKTQVQADQLRLEYDKKDQLERDKLMAEESARAREESAKLDQIDFDNQREALELEASMAETASEQRDVQQRLLDLWYRQEKAKLDAIMAEEEVGSLAWEEARRRRVALDAQQGARKQVVNQGTRGPLESYMAGLPTTAAKWNEALQQVAVDGLKSVEDGLMSIIDGTKSVGDAFADMAKSIIADLIRISIQKAIIGPLANMLFGGGGGVGGGLLGGLLGGGGGMASDGIGGYGNYATGVLNGTIPLSGVYASGGYTGNMGVNTPAGVVHGQEYVVNAKATKRYLPLLEAINSGRAPGMASGGYVGRLSIPRTAMGARVSVNDNAQSAMRGGDSYSFVFPGVTNAKEARTAGLQAGDAFRRKVARSVKVFGQ